MNCTDDPDAPSTPPPGRPIDGGALGDIISREMFEEMFPFRNDPRNWQCGNSEKGSCCFLRPNIPETTGGTGWNADIGPDFWGYCWNKEDGCPSEYCGGPIGLKDQLLQNPDMLTNLQRYISL